MESVNCKYTSRTMQTSYCVCKIVAEFQNIFMKLKQTVANINLFMAIEQYWGTGAILMPLCLSKQLILCSQQHIDQLFLGHIVYVVC